jgi:hypothetical protein
MERFNFICEIEVEANSLGEAIEKFQDLTSWNNTLIKEIQNLTELGIIN